VWLAVEPLPAQPFSDRAIRLTRDEYEHRKPFEEVTDKRKSQRLRDGVSAATAAAGVPFSSFVVKALELEEHRRSVSDVLAALPVDLTRPWALSKVYNVAFSADEIAALRDCACLSEFQVRSICDLFLRPVLVVSFVIILI
jgi:hypothetical protein